MRNLFTALCLAATAFAGAASGKTVAVKLFDMPNMSKDINSAAGNPRALEVPEGLRFTVEVTLDEAAARKVEKDPLLHQQMTSAVQGVYKDLVKVMGGAFKEGNALMLKKPLQASETAQTIGKALDAQVSSHKKQAADAANAAFEKLKKTKKEYSAYKWQAGAKLSLAIGGAITSAVMMFATGPFTLGAGTAIGIVGLGKSAVQIADQIKTLGHDAETMLAAAKADVIKLKADFAAGKSKAKAGGKQIAGLLMAEVIGKSAIPTIKDASAKLDTAENKIKGVDVKLHATAKELNEMLNKIQKLEGIMKGQPAGQKLVFIPAKIKPLEMQVTTLIGKIHEQGSRVTKAEKDLARIKAAMEKFKKANATWVSALEGFELVLSLKDTMLSPVDAQTWTAFGTALGQAAGAFVADKTVDAAVKQAVK